LGFDALTRRREAEERVLALALALALGGALGATIASTCSVKERAAS
jgi:hypothetical protein